MSLRNSGMLRGLAAVALVLLLVGPATACLWDSDTLEQEARGLPEVVRVVTGRFERNPPLYYRMRLERVTRELAAQPERLELYDDAGVAADRLGRSDEAVQWMRKKRAVLDRGPENRDHRYRYHANLGTFYVHRWLRAGADLTHPQDLRAGRKETAQALALNPQAHFGREKVQLLILDWLLNGAEGSETGLGTYLDRHWDGPRSGDRAHYDQIEVRRREIVKGLSGMIAIGNAWESPWLLRALRHAMAEQDASLELVTALRLQELEGVPLAAVGDQPPQQDGDARSQLYDPLYAYTVRKYRELRREADDWHARRTAFMEERLRAGRHPDADPAFWDGYRDSPPPGLAPDLREQPGIFAADPLRLAAVVLAAPVLVVVTGVLGLVWYRRRAARQRREGR